jgi:hypothetical protein
MLVVYPYPSAQSGSPPLLAAAYGEGDGHPALQATASGARDAIPQSYHDYEDVFDASQSARLPENSAHDHPIDLKPDSQPPHRPIYPLSAKELETLREYIEDATQKGWIRPSQSPAGAPIIFVPKKDGSLRLCVDYRGLNELTIKNRYPLPLIGETMDRLSGARIYTQLDIQDAYHRIRIRKGDEWKTAFRTRYGHFEYTVMPFGLANAPATFQSYINRALSDLLDHCCVVYLDDILIYSQSEEEHILHVKKVLDRLRAYRLYAKRSKCRFHVQEVHFLGFVISPRGISMEKDRIETILQWPLPQCVHDVLQFLGFAGFYRRFIEGFSRITAPLSATTKGQGSTQKRANRNKATFTLTPEARKAFEELKRRFTEPPVLAHFDPAKPIRVEPDASGYAVAGIASQPDQEGRWHPIAYWSRKMIDAETRYETHDAELLAIVESFKHWRHYLEGSTYPVVVLSDHANLRYFMSTKDLSRRQARWAEKLAAFDFVIEHRPGAKNPADAPSRRPDYAPKDGEFRKNSLLPSLQDKLRITMGMTESGSRQLAMAARTQGQGALAGWSCQRSSRDRTGNAVRQPLSHEIAGGSCEVSNLDQCDGSVAPAPGSGGIPTKSSAIGPVAENTRVIKGPVVRAQGWRDSSEGPRTLSPALGTGTIACRGLAGLNGGWPSPVVGGSADSACEDIRDIADEYYADGDTGILDPLVPRLLAKLAMDGETAYSHTLPTSMVELVKHAQGRDPKALDISRQLIEGNNGARLNGTPWSKTLDGLLRFDDRVYIPSVTELKEEILRTHHNDPQGGHYRVKRTLDAVRRRFYWSGITQYVKEYVEDCEDCQRNLARRHKPYGLLQPLPVPERPAQWVSMDFITGLPPSSWRGRVFDAILVIVEMFTKYSFYLPCTKDIDAPDLAELLYERIIPIIGMPENLVSDRGSLFTSQFWSTFCYCLAVRRRLSTAYHPQTDGQTERQNQTLEYFLRSYVNWEQDDWVRWLPMAQFAYNQATHSASGVSPFQALLGFKPDLRASVEELPQEHHRDAVSRIQDIQKMRRFLHEKLAKAKDAMKRHYDKNHLEKVFRVGDLVYVRAKHIETGRPSKKLDAKMIGPFAIIDKFGSQSYRLNLPPLLRHIHPTFHVSMLEEHHGNTAQEGPAPIIVDGEPEYKVERILAHKGTKPRMYRVKWEGYGDMDATWEPQESLENVQALQEYEEKLRCEPDRISKRRRRGRNNS